MKKTDLINLFWWRSLVVRLIRQLLKIVLMDLVNNKLMAQLTSHLRDTALLPHSLM